MSATSHQEIITKLDDRWMFIKKVHFSQLCPSIFNWECQISSKHETADEWRNGFESRKSSVTCLEMSEQQLNFELLLPNLGVSVSC